MAGADGQKFGKYVLLDRLAAGGMAEIFRARFMAAAGVTKPVVIKRILPHYAGNHAFVSMFINEAKIAVGLAHGNIAQVFDFGEIDGEYYLAMEYVHGQSISKLAKKARAINLPFPIPIAIYVMAEACAGLYYAHSRADEQGRPLGIVHRDVSPQNIIVSFEGQVKLVDFGIAKARLAGKNETEHGAMKGKYVYFSPEQTRSKPLDGRSDIFAAGICLYELLTGRLPFDGKMIDVLGRISRCEFDRPSLHNPNVAPELEQIVLKAMTLRAEDRFQTALEMNEALMQYLHTAWPRFSRNQVAHLAQYLCKEELEQEGVPLRLPEDFQHHLAEWMGGSKVKSSPSRPTAVEQLPPPVA
ncbi:MAG: serine/threonine protein kinase, partial [Myxococcales bacterium]